MKLNKIQIVNYRSIADISISPEPACQGFVGINESGKTNILMALSLLSPNIEISKDDVRVEGADEEREQDSYVEYYFKLSNSEMDTIVDDLLGAIYCESSMPKIEFPNKKVAISKLFSSKNTGLYYCNVEKETKGARYYTLNKNDIVPIPWLKKKATKTTAQSVNSKSGKAISLTKHKFVETNCIPDENMAMFEDCTTNDLNIYFGSLLTGYVNNNLPNVVYWKYDDKYLLPSNVNLDEFRNDPDICVPLKSMFNLAGYDDIEDILSDIEEKRANILINILKNVSEKSTEYLHKVWRDYKNVRFELRANGENIDIHIQDSENFYDCEQRSDGFKRFITFLLALSARVNNGEIVDSIIIIDEPDLGIHILGQKNLVQELIKISKNNLVFYSTHSIFMIDKRNTSRHFIVKKKNEITTIAQATESNYTDDEVLFNALGYTIFEALKARNIIFEGWSDKKVFELAIATKKGKKIRGMGAIGTVYGTGVKSIIGIAKDLELANRVYFVISDSDKPAVEKRKNYLEKEQCEGAWFTYEEIETGIYTLEDFIKHNAFKTPIASVKESYPELNDFDYSAFSKQAYKREEFIKNWIRGTISDNDKVKLIIKEVKNKLYSNIKSADIEDKYYDFLKVLNNKLKVK